MANKRIFIDLTESGTIEVKVNNDLKISISDQENEIKAEQIFETLDISYGDELELDEIDVSKITYKRYKSYMLIHEIFNTIISSIKTGENDYEYDVDVKPIDIDIFDKGNE